MFPPPEHRTSSTSFDREFVVGSTRLRFRDPGRLDFNIGRHVQVESISLGESSWNCQGGIGIWKEVQTILPVKVQIVVALFVARSCVMTLSMNLKF